MKKNVLLFLLSLTLSVSGTEPSAKWDLENIQNLRTEGEVASLDGIAGQAASFNGTSSIETGAPATPGNAVTLECWVKLDTLEQEWRGIVSRSGKGGLGYGILFRSAGNGFRFVVTLDSKTSAMVQTEKESIVPGQWYHLAGVYDGKSLTLYVNGMPFSKNASITLPEIDSPIFIGKMGAWTKEGLKGAVDEVAIYPAALSGSEVSAHVA
ncbi:MAG: LamG domain-containing protein, partial [Spirochaetia bacterium]|nr:LamG domain-containing protein [Spirochaetia bacterium]